MGIIITHHHFDHTGGILELVDHFNCEVFGPGGGHIQGITSPLNDNEEFELLGKKFIALPWFKKILLLLLFEL